MLVVGLTGSIASGKSETAKLLSNAGIPVFDSDAEVHKLYQRADVIKKIAGKFPTAVQNGAIGRKELGAIVLSDSKELETLEGLIHPLVREVREKFVTHWKKQNTSFVIIDIPLLFETGEEKNMDHVVVVSAPNDIRQQRALARPGMTVEKLAGIAKRQYTDTEKCRRANFIVDNSADLSHLRHEVDGLITWLGSLAKVRKQ